MPKLEYEIESRPYDNDHNEYQITIFGEINDCGIGGVIYNGKWTPDRLEAYQDAMQYVKSLIDDACKLRNEILEDIGKIINDL